METELLRTTAEALSEEDRDRFLALCEARDVATLRRDADRIAAHLNTITLFAAEDPLVDLTLAQRIAAALLELIVAADRLTFEQRRLLAGAIEYFVETGDAADDYRGLSGLEDDARIVRAVCAAVARPDLARGW
ncbi:MAG: hypothetical protein QNJ88_08885 [Acidimicrobiia bacterium]|nr:hypothetical protein [Acidimicrobiia bacterium]